MKAVVLGRAPGRPGAEVVDLPVPDAGPGELLVRMSACGLCGTDIEKLKGEYTASAPSLGHEAVGVVAKTGRSVAGFREGDRVFPHHHVACGECYFCRRGSETMCAEYRKSNIKPGGFSEFFVVPAWNVARGGVLKIPPDMDLELASLIEPVACCVRALDACSVAGGDSVLVAGAGPVGLLHAILLRSLGAEVIVSDVSKPRLEFARSIGAGAVLDASDPGVVLKARELASGRGVDVAIVASGSPKALTQALGAVRKGGKLCLFGIPPKGSMLEYDLSDVYNADISIVPSYGATEKETPKAVQALAARKSEFRSLITHRFRITEFGAAVSAASSGEAMKVLITA